MRRRLGQHEIGTSRIAGAFPLVAHWTSHREWYRRRVVVPASAMIAVMGVYWTIQRLISS